MDNGSERKNDVFLLGTGEVSSKTVSIIGSCVSRDAFGLTTKLHTVEGKDKYIIERYIQSINPMSAIAEPVDVAFANSLVEESEKSEASNFYKRSFRLDIQKSWYDYLAELKSEWLVIDMSTVRASVISVGDTYISYDLLYAIRKKINVVENDSTFATVERMNKIDLKSMDENYLREVYYHFFDMLMEIYPENRIIVLDVLCAHTFINQDTSFLQSPNYLSNDWHSKTNKLIGFAYDCAREYMPNAHFVNSLPILVGKINHIWGIHGLHYVDAIYEYLYECMDYIMCQSEEDRFARKAEERFIIKKQVEYAQRLFALYQNTVMSCIQAERNLLKFGLGGANQGEYLKNGVTLRVLSECEFSLNGTATEDICFFLYSYDKNPLGAWRSVVNTIEEGKYLFTTRVENRSENFYIQLVLSNSPEDIRWITGNLSTRFELTKSYHQQLIRVIIKKGTVVDVEGCMILERL